MSDGGKGFSSDESKALWQDPAYREKRSTALKEALQDPAERARKSKAVIEQMLKQWKDPAVREKMARKVECDKCGRMIGVTNLPQHQRGPRCYNPDIDS